MAPHDGQHRACHPSDTNRPRFWRAAASCVRQTDQGLQGEGWSSGDLELILRKANSIHYRTLLRKPFAKLITPGESFNQDDAGAKCHRSVDITSIGAQAQWTFKGLDLDPDALATLTLRSSAPRPLQEITLKLNKCFLVLTQLGTPVLAAKRSSGSWLWEASLSPMGLGMVAHLGWFGARERR